MSSLGLTYPDKDPCSRSASQIGAAGDDLTSLKTLLESRGGILNGSGDLSVQLMTSFEEKGLNDAISASRNSNQFKCQNGGPKTDGEWYDPNQGGQQVTAHCVIL